MKRKISCLTSKELSELALRKEPLPTSAFYSKKEPEYLVKPRGTIFGGPRKIVPLKPGK